MSAGVRGILAISDDAAFDYLRPLVEIATQASAPVVVATLNYDLGLETLARRFDVSYSRGVERWSEAGTLEFDASQLQLLKLHGSLDWRRHSARSDSSPLLSTRLEVTADDSDSRLPFLVFGQREKLRPEGPFLELLEGFRRALKSADDLVIIGYAFRDAHINEVIGSWVNASSSRRLTVVDPGFPVDADPQDFRAELVRALAATPSGRGGKRLLVVREPASTFLASLSPSDPTSSLEERFDASAGAAPAG